MESKLVKEFECTSSLESSTWAIQVWLYRLLNYTSRIRKGLQPVQSLLEYLKNEVDKLTSGIKSFEESQKVLFSKTFLESLSKILALLPQEKFGNIRLTSLARQVSLSILISKYPMEMLAGSAQDSTSESFDNGPKEVKDCMYAADLLYKYLRKMFEAWKTFDSKLMIQSLEEAYQQSYYNSILAKIEVVENPSLENDSKHAELMRSVEHQVGKIRETLEKLIGREKASSRLEELRAAVELSIPNYGRYFPNKDSTKGIRYPSPNTAAKQEKIAERVVQHTVTTTSSAANKDNKTLTNEPIKSGTVSTDPIPTSTPSSTTSSVPAVQEKSKVQMYLDAVSKYLGGSGIETERLAHEIAYDKNYRLPPLTSKSVAQDASSESSKPSPPTSLEALLKERMLVMMADQLINSLRMSKVNSYSQVKAGMIVPVKMPSLTADRQASDAIVSVHTAKIIKVYSHHTFPSRENPVTPQEDSEDDSSDDEKETKKEMMTFVDVEFLLDDHAVVGMPIQFVKLSTELPSPKLLIHNLQDLIQQIAHYLPPRSDLQNQLSSLLDIEIMTQLFVHYDTFQPFQDLYPLLKRIFLFVLNLQAEYRVEEHTKWLQEYERVFEQAAKRLPESLDENALYSHAIKKVIALTEPDRSEGENSNGEVKVNIALENIVPLLPVLFEKVSQCLEEFQYDMANYYISLVAPLLASTGHSFLANRFQTRLANRQASIQSTTQWLLSTLQTGATGSINRWQQSLQDLVEAEVLPNNENSLKMVPTDLAPLLSSSGSRWTQWLAALAFVALLQYPIRLDAPPPPPATSSSPALQYHRLIPETFAFDLSRLAKLRDLIDSIALESALLITTRQLLASRFRVMAKESEEIELAHRLDVLLGQHDVNSSFLSSEIMKFVSLVVESRRRDSSSLSSGNASPVPRVVSAAGSGSVTSVATSQQFAFDEQELLTRVEAAIKEVVSPGNAVLTLFTKRVYKVLLRGLLNQPYLSKLAPYSLHHKSQERNLVKLIDLGKRLFSHNLKIHEILYQNILFTSLSSPTGATQPIQ